MKNEWILDVLADLKSFAKSNGMPVLAEQLADTADLAAIEISSAEMRTRTVNGDEHRYGAYPAPVRAGRRA